MLKKRTLSLLLALSVMLSLFAFGAAWGVAGMLLALPALILIRTCVRVFVESVRMD